MSSESKLVKVVSAFLERDHLKNPETNEIDPTKITYRDIIEVFSGAGIREEDIFTEIRDTISAELAYGLSLVLREGGPTNADNTLRYEGVTAALKLWREVVACQADLEEEARRREDWLLKQAQNKHGGKKGGSRERAQES